MTPELAASNDDRALEIRDHLLLLVRRAGTLKGQRDRVRTISFEQPPWVVHHWMPFNDLQPADAASPGDRHAVERQRTTVDLPYDLEVWHDKMVLRVLWADDGRSSVDSFVRGRWEGLVLSL